ncbi:LOW QUALITY PROTEIN: zinc finger CCCH domain-containing protein 64 [Carica papaya]|uniref:LOW QUALITY PROTEIN: zinc finger CCCH domain-containing protein 64 n=1 Tax=Carica papaya TaxID=3649 RepID=UPI000B8C9241|nr:LOW QUALITY PROTEIN: zinc finger CCCH domain-containing protein 64 [Carica papaya]
MLNPRFAFSVSLPISHMAPPRILLSGDVLGRLNPLFKRVQSVNKSAGPFDALFCVGQFFPDSTELLDEFMDYIDGLSPVPLPTYFTGDYGFGAPKVLSVASKNSANQGFKMDGIKICDNLFWLRGSGKFEFHGLSVAYLSGRQSSDGGQFGMYSQNDVDALRALAEEPGIVDLFLTNEWPSGVTGGAASSDIPPALSDSSGSDSMISELVAEIKPRYHIAGSRGVFYAREPYSNVDAVHVTRFLGLASVGNKDKQKFIHAISPTPTSTMSAADLSAKPPNTTISPYMLAGQTNVPKEATKRSIEDASDSQYWRYDVSKKRQKHGAGDVDKLCFKFISSGSCPRGERCYFQHDVDAREQYLRGVCLDFIIKGNCEKGPYCNFKHKLQDKDDSHSLRRPRSESVNRSKECWFCLSSPNVESHLIISIGENFYCALPKGPLVQDHGLIIPIEHLPNTFSVPTECDTELCRFQNSLKMYYKRQGKEAVFFEWVSKRSTHANLQVVPIPSTKACGLEKLFTLASEKLGFKFVAGKVGSGSDGRKFLRTEFDKNFSFFYVELPDGTILFHMLEENKKFPSQFGREVLAGLLNIADRADWRNCTVGKEDETKMAEDFKKRFEVFDPNK